MFGIVIECGNGCSITNLLMGVDGASKTIYESKQPYNKEVQHKYYKGEYDRSVSLEFVRDVMNTELKNHKKFFADPIHKFLLVSSFQLKPLKDTQNILTHGWIGVYYEGTITYYHFSIPETKARAFYFSKIGHIGVELIHNLLSQSRKLFTSKFLDQVVKLHQMNESLRDTLQHTIFNPETTEDFFITVNPQNKPIRFEDLIRGKQGVILQKGSYNPIHKGHTDIMELTKEKYKTYASAFLISIYRYDKPDITIDELLERISAITSLGYHTIISRRPLFKNSLQWLRDNARYRQLPVVFPMGVDTVNRILQAEREEKIELTPKSIRPEINWLKHFHILTSLIYNHCIFMVYTRNGYVLDPEFKFMSKVLRFHEEYTDPESISSTKIRNKITES